MRPPVDMEVSQPHQGNGGGPNAGADCAGAGTTTAAGMGAGQPSTGDEGGPNAGADDAGAGTQTAADDLQGTALGELRLIASQEDEDNSDDEDDDDDDEDDDDDAPQMQGRRTAPCRNSELRR